LVEQRDGEAAGQTRVYTTWRTFTTRDGLPHNSIRAIRVFEDQVWVGTADGLAMREGQSFRSWTRKDGLPARVISAIDVDPVTRDVWLGTWGWGLVRFTAGRFDQFDQMSTGLAGNLVFDVVVDGDRVWAATNAGVSLFDVRHDTWELFFARRADQPEIVITDLSLNGKDLYAGTWRGPVQRFERRSNSWVTLPSPAVSGEVGDPVLPGVADATVGIAVGGRSLWWATQTRLLRGDIPGKWDDRLHLQRGPWDDFIYCLGTAGDTQVWLGTDRGIRVLSDWATDTWVNYVRCDGAPGGIVTLNRAGRTLAARSLESTIPDNRVRCIAFSKDHVWIGTVNGLAFGTSEKWWDELQASTDINVSDCDRRAERALPATRKVRSAAMAVFGPRSRTISLPGTRERRTSRPARPDLLAVQLALEHANKRGGTRGAPPLELTTASLGYDRYGWGTKEDDLVVFASNAKVAGIVGYIGPDDSVADAVVLRTEVPFVSAATSPQPHDEPIADNPFVFRCHGEGPRRDRLLIDYLLDKRGYARLAAVRTPGETTQRHLDWWSSHARTRGHPLVADVPCATETSAPLSAAGGRLRSVLDALRRSQAEVVLTSCDMHTSADILRQMRRAGMNQLFVGSKAIVSDEFAALVGVDPGPVIAAYPIRRLARSRSLTTFAREYAEQNVRGNVATPPGIDAYLSFDAADHLIEAIRTAGANREAVRQELERMSRSATGELHHERLREPGKTTLAHLEAGRWTFQLIP
jgi:ABC-type branched-subunit amino acid transport system substrate-binding protein